MTPATIGEWMADVAMAVAIALVVSVAVSSWFARRWRKLMQRPTCGSALHEHTRMHTPAGKTVTVCLDEFSIAHMSTTVRNEVTRRLDNAVDFFPAWTDPEGTGAEVWTPVQRSQPDE